MTTEIFNKLKFKINKFDILVIIYFKINFALLLLKWSIREIRTWAVFKGPLHTSFYKNFWFQS